MLKKFTFFLTLLLAALAHNSFGALTDYNFFYINGMSNEPNDAEVARTALHTLVLYDVPGSSVRRLYQRNTGPLGAMIEKVRQMALVEKSRETFKRFWRCNTDLDPVKCASANPSDANMQQMILDTLGAYSEAAYVQNPQLQAMVSEVIKNHNNGKKSLLLGHSQGNFYANQIVNFLQLAAPNVAACTKVVGVATPATYVAKNGPYKTRHDDAVIGAARLYFPGSMLPANYTGPVTTDPFSHNFIKSYLQPSQLRDLIRADIVLQTETVPNSTCSLDEQPPPPSVCGVPITAGGSSGTYNYLMNVGPDNRTLTANFEAYNVPDKLTLYANGVKLAGTNTFVSGFHSFSFAFNPTSLGTTQLQAVVEGNSISSTAWDLCIDCNGATNSPCPGAVPNRSVTISMSYQSWGADWFCTGGNVNIDGKFVGTLTAQDWLKVMLSPAANEPHSLSAPQAACTCLSTFGCYTNPLAKFQFSYVDGNGVNQSFEAPLARSVLFFLK